MAEFQEHEYLLCRWSRRETDEKGEKGASRMTFVGIVVCQTCPAAPSGVGKRYRAVEFLTLDEHEKTDDGDARKTEAAGATRIKEWSFWYLGDQRFRMLRGSCRVGLVRDFLAAFARRSKPWHGPCRTQESVPLCEAARRCPYTRALLCGKDDDAKQDRDATMHRIFLTPDGMSWAIRDYDWFRNVTSRYPDDETLLPCGWYEGHRRDVPSLMSLAAKRCPASPEEAMGYISGTPAMKEVLRHRWCVLFGRHDSGTTLARLRFYDTCLRERYPGTYAAAGEGRVATPDPCRANAFEIYPQLLAILVRSVIDQL